MWCVHIYRVNNTVSRRPKLQPKMGLLKRWVGSGRELDNFGGGKFTLVVGLTLEHYMIESLLTSTQFFIQLCLFYFRVTPNRAQGRFTDEASESVWTPCGVGEKTQDFLQPVELASQPQIFTKLLDELYSVYLCMSSRKP